MPSSFLRFVSRALFASATLAAGTLTLGATELSPFVLPWDDATPGITDVSYLLEKPAGRSGFVHAQDGHLFAGDKRIRFFGVNVAFGGNFPTHADAEKVAGRMAKFGVNCVRFHHMDTATAPSGLVQKDKKTLDPENLDKLDYFISRLKEHGIYADLNLHVGLEYPGYEKWEGASGYFKGVDNFFPPFIEQQKSYARTLLTHVNPYTKLAYTADPAVAFIEINNENGLMMEWNSKTLDPMPDPYAAEFSRLWNAWLTKKYGTEAELVKSWSRGEQKLGPEILSNHAIREEMTGWNLEQQEGASAAAKILKTAAGDTYLRVAVDAPGQQPWHVQISQSGIATEKGKVYSFSFRARAKSPATIAVALAQTHAPWKVLANQDVKLTPAWQEVSLALTPNETDENARIIFGNMGLQVGEYEFDSPSLRSGGTLGLLDEEALGKIAFVKKNQIVRRTLAVQQDWNRFLVDTESAYWTGMSQFIKGELGAQSVVLGSATGFSPWIVQSQLDVVDAHAYWQHPHFPHRQWDMNDWEVKNEPMAGAADGGTLPTLALRRVAGKPFIVTEYNHASPNDYSAEAFLEVMAVAALQDWDGVFAFAYSHRTNEWDTQRFTSFFDIDQHPTKMATLPAALTLFYRADLAPASQTHTGAVTMEEAVESLRNGGGSWVSGKNYGIKPQETFTRRIAMKLRKEDAPEEAAITYDGGKATALQWDTAEGRMLIDTPKSFGVVGKMKEGETIEVGGVTIKPGPTELGWATITGTVVEGASAATAKRLLITATGKVENTGFRWKNAQKTSLQGDWGKAPSLVEGIAATITIPTHQTLKAWALDERGQRRQEVPVRRSEGKAILELSPEQKTIWWEVATE